MIGMQNTRMGFKKIDRQPNRNSVMLVKCRFPVNPNLKVRESAREQNWSNKRHVTFLYTDPAATFKIGQVASKI